MESEFHLQPGMNSDKWINLYLISLHLLYICRKYFWIETKFNFYKKSIEDLPSHHFSFALYIPFLLIGYEVTRHPNTHYRSLTVDSPVKNGIECEPRYLKYLEVWDPNLNMNMHGGNTICFHPGNSMFILSITFHYCKSLLL